MEQKNIALELLVRSGNPKSVEKLAEVERIGEPLRTEKVAEAGIYSAIKVMWEEAEGGIDSTRICQFLNQSRYGDYFNSTRNIELLEKIVDVLQAGTHAQMEAYAQITAIDVLGVDSLAGAIRRNIDAPHMKEKVTKLVQKGYSLVFCPHDIDANMVKDYFPIIDKWRDFVNPLEVAAQVINGISKGSEDLFEYDYQKEFVYAALDKLTELTNRETVSRLMYEHFGEHEDYRRFIDDGKIDACMPKPVIGGQTEEEIDVERAIKKYENERFPSNYDVKNLANALGNKGRNYVAQRMGQWFKKGRMKHLREVATFEEGILYNHDVARRALSEAVAESCQQGDLTRLDWILDFPQRLIDETNSAISGVVQAYRISQQTKEQQ